MQFRDRPIAVWAFPLAMLVGCLLLFSTDAAGIGTRLRGILFDAYQYSAPRDWTPQQGWGAATLAIDDASIQRFGAWPWPRATLAELSKKLRSAGARVVLVMPLDRPDSLSAQNVLAALPAAPDAQTQNLLAQL